MTSATAEAPAVAEGDGGRDTVADSRTLGRALMFHSGDWTLEDLVALDLGRHPKIEIDDGSLLVSPTPTMRHQLFASFLEVELRNNLRGSHPVSRELNLQYTAKDHYEPDVVVLRGDWTPRDDDPDGKWFRPEDFVVVIEVESPGTRTYDRVNKLHAYARLGIPAYWRVEIQPEVAVVEYRLATGGRYEVLARHTGSLKTDFPAPMSIDLDRMSAEVAEQYRPRRQG